jgi:16S rRNA (guanine966-N2)-methyltransferase
MRITAGRLKGRALVAPADLAVRPTSDKVRQAIFNILEHSDLGAFRLEGARAVDLFAGTGALGLEALSRSARYALFIDDAAESRALIRRNVEGFGLTGVTKIWKRNATDLGPVAGEPYSLAFLDPPYRKNLVVPALNALRSGGWLSDSAIAVAETAEDEPVPEADGSVVVDARVYGDTRVVFMRRI